MHFKTAFSYCYKTHPEGKESKILLRKYKDVTCGN